MKYNGDVTNRFNVLFKEGRRRKRSIVGRNAAGGEVEGSGDGGDGC